MIIRMSATRANMKDRMLDAECPCLIAGHPGLIAKNRLGSGSSGLEKTLADDNLAFSNTSLMQSKYAVV
jgi:hypothetical protein